MDNLPETCILSERSAPDEIKKINSILRAHPVISVLVNTTPDIILMLNRHRQIVMANDNLLEILNIEKEDLILGKKPGEALSCIHCEGHLKGCGTTSFCRYCGAINAIFNSTRFKSRDIQECNITVKRKNGILGINFLVMASPFEFEGEDFTVFTVRNISEQKFHHVLERVFFHDVLHLAGTVEMLLDLLPSLTEEEIKKFYSEGLKISRQLISEIESHRDLINAEKGNLEVKIEEIYIPDFLSLIITLYKNHRVCEGRFISGHIESDILYICSDKILLSRILGNLIKNALEASRKNHTVTVTYKNDIEGIRFLVHNRGTMSEEIKHQIFNRSFTGKNEKGRGFGTYTVKLLTERYLNGHVAFTSSEDKGTAFTVWL